MSEAPKEHGLKPTIDAVLALLADQGARLHALLMRLTLREDVAEDLMQELFLRLSQRDGFARADDPAAYAFRTAVNLAFDWRRAQKRLPRMEHASSQLLGHDRSPLSVLLDREQLKSVLEAIGSLPERSRDVLVLRYLEQWSYETIGRAIGKTPHQVRGLCYKAVTRLRRLLDSDSSARREIGRSECDP